MNNLFKSGLVIIALIQVHLLPAQDILEQLKEIAIVDQKVMMPMRDGVRLATDIYRPKTDKKVPVIFSRTPYNFNTWVDGEMRTRTLETALKVVQKGYAYVVQNERGRFFSEGEWDILGTPLLRSLKRVEPAISSRNSTNVQRVHNISDAIATGQNCL